MALAAARHQLCLTMSNGKQRSVDGARARHSQARTHPALNLAGHADKSCHRLTDALFGASSQGCAASAQPWNILQLLNTWFDAHTSGAGGRYELAEPLLALRGVLARALDRPEQAVEVALEAARQARRAGDLPNAMSALHNIKRAAATCAPTSVTQTGIRKPLTCAAIIVNAK